jgi:hypothetical protein
VTYSLILENASSTTALSGSSENQLEIFKRVVLLVLDLLDKTLHIAERRDEGIFRDIRGR